VHPEDAVAIRLGLVAALQRLPQRQREAVALHYLGGLTDAEVGRALGVSTGTVKTHIHRALGSLRGLLADDEIEEGPLAYALP
jgi:RNA polymerase sigma factor (sigma-70 family)